MKPGRIQTQFLCMAAALSLGAQTAYPQTVYWTDVGTGKIQRADLDGGTGVEDLVTTQVIEPVGLALDLVAGKMYWTEASPADFMISRANLDGTNVELLVTGLDHPSGITLDVVGGKMYWTDIGTGKIQRGNLNGSSVEDLLTIGAVFTPVDIALDVSGNKIYWTESTLADFMIQRADLDGSNVELLVTDLVNPSGIALDVAAGKMYWTDLGTGKIQRANLDGSGVEDLVTTSVIEPVRIALDLQAGKIYWTEASPADFMISRAELDGTGVEFLITGLTSPSGIDLVPLAGPTFGACCFDIGFCTPQTQEECESVEGQLYLGDGTECVGDFTCPAMCWTCLCTDGLSDSDQSAIGCFGPQKSCDEFCQGHGGTQSFQCDLGPCISIPTVSEWGLVVMTLLVLTAGSLLFARARAYREIS
ncbi:MAG: hypothetical protein IH987_09045 [Planctomycetes bacterium]|nr:hypothetical protein [Planctomycetota bacterium]